MPGRGQIKLISLCLGLSLATAGFTALGIWQLERRIWKLDLIRQVDYRIHAAPEPAPGPDQWSAINAAHDAYRRVMLRGRFLNDKETPVHATTIDGPGYWILTPLQTDAGFIVLVNRGFVPTDKRDAHPHIDSTTDITGLLRISEPKGGFLRDNRPAEGQWYSRDVAAIVADKKLSDVAPYFIDADAAPDPDALPIGGLTVISFPNNHLVYALTWFALALLSAGFIVMAVRKK
jgi:surfeit locus 1 family protein